ncbi:cytochrome c [Novosphingobium sp. FSW06-99]|uniref:c-type cytochrome n=1 Tax=Novosphingobium sp. FSW06-99 TaxID=1739113 RepID=UPI00076D68B3|nr:cytochrome c [Novosphingobium sp. FSW06-99]KUR74339.1 alcohol dehydrogenase [Novosphingobium sp. FSW06-99]
MIKKHKTGLVALAAVTLVASATLASPGFAQDRPGPGGNATVDDSGKEVFEQICAACHMADAKGGGEAGARVPALAGNKNLANKDYPIIILLKGRGGMPWFTDILTKPQIAAVITYVRGHFNDYKDPVTVADIDRIGSTNPPVPDCNCGH